MKGEEYDQNYTSNVAIHGWKVGQPKFKCYMKTTLKEPRNAVKTYFRIKNYYLEIRIEDFRIPKHIFWLFFEIKTRKFRDYTIC